MRRAALDKERKIAALFAAVRRSFHVLASFVLFLQTQQRENKVAELEATALSLVNLHKELLKPLEVPQCVRELAFNPDATYRKLLVIGVANKKQRTAEDPFWIACLDKVSFFRLDKIFDSVCVVTAIRRIQGGQAADWDVDLHEPKVQDVQDRRSAARRRHGAAL